MLFHQAVLSENHLIHILPAVCANAAHSEPYSLNTAGSLPSAISIFSAAKTAERFGLSNLDLMYLYFGSALTTTKGIWKSLNLWLNKHSSPDSFAPYPSAGAFFFSRGGPYARILANYRQRTKAPDNSLTILACQDAVPLTPKDLRHLGATGAPNPGKGDDHRAAEQAGQEKGDEGGNQEHENQDQDDEEQEDGGQENGEQGGEGQEEQRQEDQEQEVQDDHDSGDKEEETQPGPDIQKDEQTWTDPVHSTVLMAAHSSDSTEETPAQQDAQDESLSMELVYSPVPIGDLEAQGSNNEDDTQQSRQVEEDKQDATGQVQEFGDGDDHDDADAQEAFVTDQQQPPPSRQATPQLEPTKRSSLVSNFRKRPREPSIIRSASQSAAGTPLRQQLQSLLLPSGTEHGRASSGSQFRSSPQSPLGRAASQKKEDEDEEDPPEEGRRNKRPCLSTSYSDTTVLHSAKHFDPLAHQQVSSSPIASSPPHHFSPGGGPEKGEEPPLQVSPAHNDKSQRDASAIDTDDASQQQSLAVERQISISWASTDDSLTRMMDFSPGVDNRLNDIVVNDVIELLTACVPHAFTLRSSAAHGSACFRILQATLALNKASDDTQQSVVYWPVHIQGAISAKSSSGTREHRDNSQDHWVLAIFQMQRKKCLILDSLTSAAHFQMAESLVHGVIKHAMPQGWDKCADWTIVAQPRNIQQVNGFDCGIAVIAHTFYHLSGGLKDEQEWPRTLDGLVWRAIILALVKGMAGANVDERLYLHILNVLTKDSEARDMEYQLSQRHGGSVQHQVRDTASVIQLQIGQTQPVVEVASRALQAYKTFSAALQARHQLLCDLAQLFEPLHSMANSRIPMLQATEARLTGLEPTFKVQIEATQAIIDMATGDRKALDAMALMGAQHNHPPATIMATNILSPQAEQQLKF